LTGVLRIKTKECKIVDCRWRTEKNSRRKAIPIADFAEIDKILLITTSNRKLKKHQFMFRIKKEVTLL
jgi:hypothetical protein